MQELAEGLQVQGGNLMREVAVRVGSTLVLATPRDTNLARSNWVASLGIPDETGRPISSEVETIAAIQSALAGAKADSTVFIVNTVPYIGGLNAGTSKQAPANFVRKAITAGLNSLNDVRILKK